jgi:hypothetical protein
MKFKTLLLWTMVVAGAVLMLASCSTKPVYRSSGKKIGHGPPPHAPAHGYRRKLPAGVEVVFDSASGVYVVVGLEKHFWLDGHYYRFCNRQWEASVSIGGGWIAIGEERLPAGLRGKYKAKHASKSHPGRGWGLATKKW